MALYLSRIPTCVSLWQMQEESVSPPAAQPLEAPTTTTPDGECPVTTCVGKALPTYKFAVKAAPKASIPRIQSFQGALVPDVDDSSSQGDCGSPQAHVSDEDQLCPTLSVSSSPTSNEVMGSVLQKSLLDTALLALWEDCAEQGLFRYDVTACPTKVLPGMYGFIAQLNEGRATKKRATEFRVDQVCQPFEEGKFNFKKAYMREVLLQFEPSTDGKPHLLDSAKANSSPNLVFINVSPIEYGHVLLVPKVLDNLPQLVDPATILLALRFALEADNPYFRIGYNSLGAYATINHLHFQAYYLAAPYPCERAPTMLLKGLKRKRNNVQLSRLVNYPVNGFVVEVGDSLEEMAEVVGQACVRMQQKNIPHNLIISDSGSRVFIFPQCYAEKQAQNLVPEEMLGTGVNPAAFEIAGHMVLKRKEDYDNFTQDFAWRMLEQVSLSEDKFQQTAMLCFE